MTARIAAFRLLSVAPDALLDFYRTAFGCENAGDGRLALGPSIIEIKRAKAAYPAGVGGNDPRFQHFAIVVADMDRAMAALQGVAGWNAISVAGPERLPAASGGVAAFKFRDPDGHPLELLAFPPERAPAQWRGRDGLFSGINHSAIAVADVARSLSFYEGLGFRLAARQVNHGAEQARLDGLKTGGATKVEVVSLVADGVGPHLELLSYLDPPMRLSEPVAALSAAATRIILAGAGAPKGEIVDPDGHRLERSLDRPDC